MTWNYIIIAISLFLLLVLFWKEISRPNKAHLFWRLLCSFLAIASLACLALPLTYQKTIQGQTKQPVLLTEGFVPDSLSPIKNAIFLTSDTNLAHWGSLKPEYIPNLAYYLQTNPDIKQLHIAGYGLNEAELQNLPPISLIFHPAKFPSGIRSIHWTKKIKSGNRLAVQGNFQNSSSQPIKLVLMGLNTALDSTIIPAGKTSAFELNATPKHLGKAVYSLLTVSGKDTLSTEPLPLETIPGKPLKVLILSSAPDFENNFLKNWLFENHYSLAIRSAISTNKYSQEFLNTDKISLDKITGPLLEKFDLVIGDLLAFNSLSPAESQALQNQVNQGLGLLLRFDPDAGKTGFFGSAFATYSPTTPAQKTVSVLVPGQKESLLPTEQVFYIHPQSGNQPLIKTKEGQILVNSKISGYGKIALSTLNNTFTWMLEGNQADYNSFWTTVLEKTARKNPEAEIWEIANPFPTANQQIPILLETSFTSIPNVMADSTMLAIKQNADLPFQWSGNYWPRKSGWHTLQQEGGTPFNWYVYEASDWKSLKVSSKMAATSQFSRQNPAKDHLTIPPLTESVPVPAIWFYLLFLASCAYLWFETKML
ncbi:MAG TPA: hypothetical protein VEV16_04505 [Daejeonella sp.]|nr:hypothetical protein [Daejeonella sp.]